MPSFSVPLCPIWGPKDFSCRLPDFVPLAAIQGSRVLPACRAPGPAADPTGTMGAQRAFLSSVPSSVLNRERNGHRWDAPPQTVHRVCDQGCDRKETATSQGGLGPAGLSSGGRSQGWDGQVPRHPPPASWLARGGRGSLWPFGMGGSMGLRKASAGLRGQGLLLACRWPPRPHLPTCHQAKGSVSIQTPQGERPGVPRPVRSPPLQSAASSQWRAVGGAPAHR